MTAQAQAKPSARLLALGLLSLSACFGGGGGGGGAPDTTAPDTTITSGPAHGSVTSDTTATFEFEADEAGATFECNDDGGGWVPCTSPHAPAGPLDLGAPPEVADRIHTFAVRATDGAGNTDTTPDFRTWTVDDTLPDTVISGAPNDPSGDDSPTFTFHSSELDASFECDLDGGGFAPCVSPHPLAGLTDGPHLFTVVATDLAGNSDDTPASHAWEVNTLIPEASIDSGPAEGSASALDTADFTFSSPNDPAALFECDLDGGGYAGCASPLSLTGLAHGGHTFRVRATNGANTGSPDTRNWSVDLVDPETTIATGPPDPDNETSPEFSFSADEPASFECDSGGGWSPCTSPHTVGPLADGPHTFTVRATDGVGRTDATPATWDWTIDTDVPDTTIDSGPPDPDADSTPTFAFSSPDATATFECRVDAGPWYACTSPHTTASLADGPRAFEVRATDGVNADPSPDSWGWTVDTTPPDTLITSTRPPDPDTDDTPTFTFVGNEGGVSFECELDGGGFSPCTSPHTTAALADGPHTFAVRAVDPAGNEDPSPDSHSWSVDATPPDTSVDTGPTSPTADTDADFTFSSPDGTATFECRVDGGGWGSCTSPVHEPGPFAEGPHSFEARATDPAGNQDQTPAKWDWTVDLGPPETTITAGPADPVNETDADFEFESDEAGSTFLCRLDAGSWVSCTSPHNEPGPLGEGGHTFEVAATDAAGNPDATPDSWSWTIDLTLPDTSIDSAPPDPDNDSTPTFTFSSPDATASFECRVDASPWAACTSPHTTAALGGGARTFEARAVDPASNADPTPASHSWTVDLVAPETTIDSGPDDPTNETDAEFEFSADETASFECDLDGGGWGACSSPHSVSGPLGSGAHSFKVRATDAAGNLDSTPAEWAWIVDLAAPETTLDSAPNDPDNKTEATFEFSMSDGLGVPSFECRLDGASWAACTSPHTETGLSEASHTFEVRAIDGAGNQDASPASHTWTVDTGFVFAPFFDGFESGDFSGGPWVRGGDFVWLTQGASRFNGLWAAESGLITHNQDSTIEIRVYLHNAGYVRFAFLASTEGTAPPQRYDYLNFSIDGVEQDYWDFEWPWQLASYPLTAGMHTLKWRYVKDPGVSHGLDLGRLDDVEVAEGSAPPLGPDLLFTQFDAPASAFWGDSIEVHTNLHNQGAVGTSATTSEYRLSADNSCDAGDTLLAGTQAHGGLAPAADEWNATTLGLPASGAAGTWWLCAFADRGDAVAEDSEANNWRLASGPIEIAATGSWLLETLETGGKGAWPALDLAAGDVYAIWHDAKDHDLRHGLGSAGKPWSFETAAGGGLTGDWVGTNGDVARLGDGTVVAVHYDDGNRRTVWAEKSGGPWSTGVLDPDVDTGGWVSLHEASDGALYAAWFDFTDGDVKVAKRTGSGAWSIETAASAGCVGYYPEIVDDGASLVVFFHSLTAGTLVAAHRPLTGGPWALDTVDAGTDVGYEIGAVFGSDGAFHLSYHDKAAGSLKHAWGTIGSWSTETIEGGGVGRHTAIAEGPGGVFFVSYQDFSSADLKLATGGAGSWSSETVDPAGDTAHGTDVAVEGDGTVHIVYHQRGTGAMKHAWRR